MATDPGIDVRRSADRPRTMGDGVSTWHCFSFGRHYDPANTAFGPLIAVNEEVLEPGCGYEPHHHGNIDIVTWMVAGSLVHEDSSDGRHVVAPGAVQRLSAGADVVHSELAQTGMQVRFIQMWVTPDEVGGESGYDQQSFDDLVLESGLVVVAAGRPARPRAAGPSTPGPTEPAGQGHAASGSAGARDVPPVTLRRIGASMLVGRIPPGHSRTIPDAPLVHLFVVDGEVELAGGERLGPGDSARLTSVPGVVVTGIHHAEVVVWQFEDLSGC